MKEEKIAKKLSSGSIMKKRLSDISNLQSQPKIYGQEESLMQISPSTKCHIERLVKENMALMRLIEERTKLIELSGVELQKLRASLQKMQLQNWNLARTNSHMLAELNLGKEKLRALQHELGCKNAVIKAKKSALEGNGNMNCQKTRSQDGDRDVENCVPKIAKDKAGNTNRRQAARSRSMGPSTASRQAAEKETAENKRRCLRRQSARFKSQEREDIENDLFEIEDVKFTVTQPLDSQIQEEGDQSPLDSSNKTTNGQRDDKSEAQDSRRSSVGRPLRRAAGKVQSYKEVPLNIKMRREE